MKRNDLGRTELKPVKEAELMEKVLDNAQLGIVITDMEHELRYVNPEFTRIFGYSEEEAIGKSIYDLIYPEERLFELEQLTERLGKSEPSEFETLRRRKDGRRIDVLCRVSPIIINGEHVGGFAFYSDISEQKRSQEALHKAHNELEIRVESRTRELREANEKLKSEIRERERIEEALRESEEGYRTAVENSNDGIAIVRNDRGLYHNQRLAEIYGYESPEELLSVSAQDIVHPDDLQMVLDNIKRRQRGEIPAQRYENKGIKKDGSTIHVEVSVAKTIYKGQAASLIYTRDVTEHKKAEEERKELEAKLQRAQRMEAIGTLAGGVAHDLNNILSGIVSYPALLLMDLPQDSPLREPIVTIQESGKKAAAIVQDLLTLARRGVSAAEVVNVNQLLSEYLKSPEYEKLKNYHPHVTTETRFEKELLDIIGSPIHLGKTIMNLISNAAEAMPEGGRITISTDNLYVDSPMKHKGLDAGEYVVLSVSDTGTGISPDDMERIYEPFFTKKAMGRNGTGLGMAIVWGTVKDHDGQIDVQSQIDKGATFTLYFPATRKKREKDRSELSIEDYMGHGESILVVDDAEEQRKIASRILERLGYSAISVPSGEKAVAYLKDHSVDLIVLDMIMAPGIDGLETYQRILESHPEQKAIIASGFSETNRVKEALKLGAGGYVKKPYLLERIGSAVRKELDRL